MKHAQTSIVLTALVGLATCADVCKHHADRSKDPSGNPLRQPALDTQVPRGDEYDIKWDPTTTGTVSIALLRGPSSNAEEYACLANSIPNKGSFEWKPSTDLEIDTSRYGLKIIDDATGNYQFSAQFGVKNGDNEQTKPSSSSKKASSSHKASATSSAAESQSSPAESKKTHKSYTASGSGYIYHNATTSTSSSYPTGSKSSTSSKVTTTSKPTSTKTTEKDSASTSVAIVVDSASGSGAGDAGTSTAVVGVDGGEAGAATATATAESAPSSTPATLSSNSASGLKITTALLGGVAAVMFFVL